MADPPCSFRAPESVGDSLVSFEMDAGKIRDFQVIRNPDKLHGIPLYKPDCGMPESSASIA